MKHFTLIAVLTLFSIGTSFGQKYGYINLGNLVAALPETKAADQQISDYGKQLITKGEDMAKVLQEDYLNALKLVESGKLSPIEQSQTEKKLQDRQAEIANYEREMQQKMALKREELLKPIFAKVESAIEAVGKEGGYVMIFDTSVFNAVLFTEEKDDVTPLVKARLGIN